MQAYAPLEWPATARLRGQGPTTSGSRRAFTEAGSEMALLDHLLGRLADLVADRLVMRTASAPDAQAGEWMDAHDAAAYLGMHRDTLRKLAAQRAIPVHQDGPGCKLYFNRDELDQWRRAGRAPRTRLRAVS